MAQSITQKKDVHTVTINERKNIQMTGVIDVGNFSQTCIDITTLDGTIILKGKDFNISKLDTDLGELSICGEVLSLQYTKTKKKRSAFEGLFK